MPSNFCQQAKLITVFWADTECHYRRPLQKPKSNFKIESWKSVFLKVKTVTEKEIERYGFMGKEGVMCS